MEKLLELLTSPVPRDPPLAKHSVVAEYGACRPILGKTVMMQHPSSCNEADGTRMGGWAITSLQLGAGR